MIFYSPAMISMDWPSARVMMAFFSFRLCPDAAPEALDLAFSAQGINRRHLDLEQVFDRRLDLEFIRVQGHPECDLVVLGYQGRLFRHHG